MLSKTIQNGKKKNEIIFLKAQNSVTIIFKNVGVGAREMIQSVKYFPNKHEDGIGAPAPTEGQLVECMLPIPTSRKHRAVGCWSFRGCQST